MFGINKRDKDEIIFFICESIELFPSNDIIMEKFPNNSQCKNYGTCKKFLDRQVKKSIIQVVIEEGKLYYSSDKGWITYSLK